MEEARVDDDSDDSDDNNEDEVPLAEIPEWTSREILVTIASILTVSLSISGAFFMSIDFFLDEIFNLFALIIPTYSAFQEQKVTEVYAMKMVTDKLESVMGRMKLTNEKMTKSVDTMEQSVSNLHRYQIALADAREFENIAIDDLEESLEVSKEILKQQEENLLGGIIDNIITVFLQADENQDSILSEEETDVIIKAVEGLHNIDLDDNFVRQKIDEYGNDLNGVLKVVNDIFDKDPDSESYLTAESVVP